MRQAWLESRDGDGEGEVVECGDDALSGWTLGHGLAAMECSIL